MKEQRNILPGDTIRLYGFPGTFRVVAFDNEDSQARYYDFLAVPSGKSARSGFGVSCLSVVELNGEPMPLMSCPICPPADDYPHVPQFAYNDGPPSCGQDALRHWENRNQRQDSLLDSVMQ